MIKNRIKLFVSFAITLIATTTFSQERFVKPVDEGEKDASFVAFRKRLIAAVERKDAKFVYGMVDTKIKLSFGGDEGIASFKRIWKLESPKSPFWSEFSAVIGNGGHFTGGDSKSLGEFFAPYTFNGFPNDLDAFEYYSIFGFDVNLRKEPNLNSPVISKLSYNVVTIDKSSVGDNGEPKTPGWLRIKTLGGMEGYVKDEYVRSPIDYRAGFEKKRGIWKMTVFIAGD